MNVDCLQTISTRNQHTAIIYSIILEKKLYNIYPSIINDWRMEITTLINDNEIMFSYSLIITHANMTVNIILLFGNN